MNYIPLRGLRTVSKAPSLEIEKYKMLMTYFLV